VIPTGRPINLRIYFSLSIHVDLPEPLLHQSNDKQLFVIIASLFDYGHGLIDFFSNEKGEDFSSHPLLFFFNP
jgi:hypothetical protein